ncbi:MAG: M48 family metallopeptidase [Bacteroidetes bacterium]|nr:M48 family metallopeptidase [Bacteroidota bacterium]
MKQILLAASGNKNSLAVKMVIISGHPVSIIRKKIKHIHLRICPPDGKLQLSAPLHVSLETIEKFITHKLPWIEKAIVKVQTQKPIMNPEYINGEKHYFLGQSYTLLITELVGKNSVRLHDGLNIEIQINETASAEQVEKILIEWYRQRLKELIPGLLASWEPVLGVHALEWGVKRMKTRWGSCNPVKKRIWLSLELIKRPVICLEYILVHELTHLLESSHNARFYTLLDSFMPDWHNADKILKEFGRKIYV